MKVHSEGLVVAVRHKPRHRVRCRDLRVQGRHPPVGKHSAADMAQHRPRVLGLRDDGAPNVAYARESGCCLAGARAKALLVGRRAAISVVERIATFSYFIPTMLWLMDTEDLPQAEVQDALSQWMLLNYGRHVLTLGAWLAALKAFSLPGTHGG